MIPWCSALSLRALFYTEPFYPNYVLDQKTGILQKDRRSETWTVISRIDSLWNHISQKRKDFESKPDTGLMSKDVVRVVHKFVQYVLKVIHVFFTGSNNQLRNLKPRIWVLNFHKFFAQFNNVLIICFHESRFYFHKIYFVLFF